MDYFFYNTIHRYKIIFGSLFSNIHVRREDPYDVHDIDIRVPLRYGNKNKTYIDLKQNAANVKRPGEIQLPIMSYNFEGIEFDNERNAVDNKLIQFDQVTNGTASSMGMPRPFNLKFGLYIWTKHENDMYQILEQILYTYSPKAMVTIHDFVPFDIKRDIHVVMDSSTSDSEIGAELTEEAGSLRILKWAMSFTLKGYLYPIVQVNKVIKEVNAYYRNYDPYTLETDEESEIRHEDYIVYPFDSLETDDYQVKVTITQNNKIHITFMDKE